MNTIEELTTQYGIEKATAQSMIDTYMERIGTTNGEYEIEDITYIGDGSRLVREVCKACGERHEKIMVKGRNKWSELRKTCPACEKRNKEEGERRKKAEKEQETLSIIGKEYGDFLFESMNDGRYIGKCKECGCEKRFGINSVLNGMVKDFSCHEHSKRKIKFDDSYIGRKNNHLTVIGCTKHGTRKWFLCECDCGNICVIKPTYWESGKVVACGCLMKVAYEDRSEEAIHLRTVYNGMKDRCYNPSNESYRNYGGRGIKICDEWFESIESFVEWGKKGYKKGLTIDRIDVNGDYEPRNCRWATPKEQANNRRPKSEWALKRPYILDGKAYTKTEFAEHIGMNLYRVDKLLKQGMSAEEIARAEWQDRQ